MQIFVLSGAQLVNNFVISFAIGIGSAAGLDSIDMIQSHATEGQWMSKHLVWCEIGPDRGDLDTRRSISHTHHVSPRHAMHIIRA